MSTRAQAGPLAGALFGKARRAILALLFTHDQESFYLRQIIRAVGQSPGAVQRELAVLTSAGLLVRTANGHQVYYRANRESPVFAEMKSLMVKTAGVADILRSALSPLGDRIKVAFLYGSLARGAERKTSDVDVMVVGEVTFAEVVLALRSTQEVLRREVNATVWSPGEFHKKRQAGQHFLKAVLKAPRVLLIGSENELG
jgi:predicted nucleotidyltransferase